MHAFFLPIPSYDKQPRLTRASDLASSISSSPWPITSYVTLLPPLRACVTRHLALLTYVSLCLGRHCVHDKVATYTALGSLARDYVLRQPRPHQKYSATRSRPSRLFSGYLRYLSLFVSLSFVTSAERINLPMLVCLYLLEGRKQAWRTGMDGCIIHYLFCFTSLPLAAGPISARPGTLLPGQSS